MVAAEKIKPQDKFVTVDGLKLRYIEEGSGPSVLFLHGASLGSSADVFLRNLGPFARAGFRAVAFDMPGFGLSDIPEKQSVPQQRNSIPKFIDAAGLGKTALIAHSRSGGFAVQLALEDPSRYSHVIILGTGSLLPPQTQEQVGKYEAVQARVDKEMAQKEPTLEDARKLLQADTFNHSLISEEDVAMRHSRMISRNFKAHQDRQSHDAPAGGGAPSKPLWQRLTELKMPLLMIFGREDRAHAGERAELLKKMHPEIDLHIVNGCKHMVHWDAFDDLMRLGVPFLKS
jgi:4,5:9,10-diseco-3-hydroxy-5,9,17-trioxoandrosta-1(10),2-diene-4-oate hydrolase